MEKNKQALLLQAIEDVFAFSFSKYAKYIIQDRALPDLRDGLKPVQRRILYGMYQMGLKPTSPYKKSARAVGEIMGKYHPHGDASIYDAIVRMSQAWKNNLTTISIHGNNGSIDGDNAAAMRYTEARLSPYGFELLKDIEKQLVPFVNNFDDSEVEPSVLPTLLPNLFINGTSGIAAGYATNIAPHNVGELLDGLSYRIENPDCDLKAILKIVKGPDFPTGGLVYFEQELANIYQTGKGKFVIQAKYETNTAFGQNQIVITEIPYETVKANIVKQIEELISDNKLSALESVIDSSDRSGIRIIINHKDFLSADKIMAFLFKHTQLQVNFNLNNTVIANRCPVRVGLLAYFDQFLAFAHELIINSAKYDLALANKRLEIIKGLIKAVSMIDEIIRLIRRATDKQDAKTKLIDKYAFTLNQAEAIVSLRLYQLTNTDIKVLFAEQKELEQTIQTAECLIAKPQARNQLLQAQFFQYKKQFNQPRRAQIVGLIEKQKVQDSDFIEHKEVGLLISHDGIYFKFEPEQLAKHLVEFKSEQDQLIFGGVVQNSDYFFMVTSLGNIITVPIYKTLSNTKTKMNELLAKKPILMEDEKLVLAGIVNPDKMEQQLLVLTSQCGMVKRVELSKVINTKQIKSSCCMALRERDKLVNAFVQTKREPKLVCLVSSSNSFATFLAEEIPIISNKGIGVKGIKLKAEEKVRFAMPLQDNDALVVINSDGGVYNFEVVELAVASRMSVGKKLIPKTKTPVSCFAANKHSEIIGHRGKNGSDLFTLNELNRLPKSTVSQMRLFKWS
ncbi:DNA topoisomerase IV subunit A [Mycoplasmoides pneumoniae]|uniref:DNA topoisomerase (ATP-hydrolyzing) n=3 Tax=Mycoplasmoides pneumoniae TaxID=2104 RepID=A0AB38WB98_MYCPM|nr:DNA topoisomerase IV subunit A [Mycoplasmoides pneumoniae]ADK86685.1 DNA topoisomerase IV, A subunit [Mycoplasmoides pneumoniae FH]ALA30970.1 DNA topoisomerase [Mycoplasmoides pneumoniae 19294]ALA31407.1 DNA topoisomerase [Mycoplasmoides pneumoniae 39443]ALA35640.1 DNA topoisomerase [Mycoplasmoides pneumoniae FH]ALA36347.1 DNA topoisomerase [Mycoplasmoides pneumoniae M1139]